MKRPVMTFCPKKFPDEFGREVRVGLVRLGISIRQFEILHNIPARTLDRALRRNRGHVLVVLWGPLLELLEEPLRARLLAQQQNCREALLKIQALMREYRRPVRPPGMARRRRAA